MDTQYEWIISAMERKIKEGDLEKIVTSVHYKLKATRDGITCETYSCVSIPEPSTNKFTPYEELSKDQVLGWVENALGDELVSIKDSLNRSIDLQITPIRDTVAPPF